MAYQKTGKSEPHYYSERLKQKLNMLCYAPATVVEAPSGYGKMTAIRDFLETGIPQNTSVYWFTATDEAPAAGFRRLCREIDKIDSGAGQRLLKTELPNAATVGEACDALRSIECKHETYLVIDNFQFLQTNLPASFLIALLEHGGGGLHIIMAAQMFKRDMIAYITGHGILHITAADLRLDAEDIRRYYALAAVDITPEDAHTVFRCTEGWIIGVYLQLCAYRERKSVSDRSGILSLMEHLVWDTLSNEQQTFLLSLSPFDMVTVQQACTLMGCDTLPPSALDALGSPFIRYEAAEKRYELHSILSELLIQKRKERGAAFERQCLLKAGDYYRNEGETDKALAFYMQMKDYERMLSLDLSHITLESIGNVLFPHLALDIAQNCPYEIKKANILSMLQIAWTLLTVGKNTEFDLLMAELYTMLDMLEESGAEDASLLRGEWLLVSSWRRLPHLDEMATLLKRAAPLFQGTCSRVILPSAPWCFGNYSQLAVFHNSPGEADREAAALAEYLSLYSRLTAGHGSGADALFRAELAHYRGNLNEAEILAYKAIFLAESKQQSIVRLGAALHLAEIAVEKSDMVGWQRAIALMEQAASYPGQNNFVLHAAVDMLRGLLLNELQYQNRISDWLKSGETTGKLLPEMELNALFVRLSYFMHEGKFSQLAGVAEAGREALRPVDALADTMLSILTAIGHMWLDNPCRAEELLENAMQKALPDGFVYLFAVYHWMLKGLPEKLIRQQYPQQLTRFLEIRERFITGFTTLHNGVMADELPGDLTAREREVALLAADGLHNSEIAQRLMVTENTVRFHLRTIFQKLDIDRRAKLAEKLK